MQGNHALLTALLPAAALMLHAAFLTPALSLLHAACCCCLLLFRASSQSSVSCSLCSHQRLLLLVLSTSLSTASRARRLRFGMFART